MAIDHSVFLHSLNYKTAPPGTKLVLHGHGFGKEQGEHNTVLFADSTGLLHVHSHPTFWSDIRIEVPVPNDARTGNVGVLKGGKFSNQVHLNVSPEGVLIPWF